MHFKQNSTGLKTFISFKGKHLFPQKLASISWMFNDCLHTRSASREKDNLTLLRHTEVFYTVLKLLLLPRKTTWSHQLSCVWLCIAEGL